MDFVAGYVGGVAGTVISHPLDVVRTRQVTVGNSLTGNLRELWLAGPRTMFAGIVSPCVYVGLWKGIVLGLNKKILEHRGPEPSQTDILFASVVSGIAGGIAIGPLELVKVRAMSSSLSKDTNILRLELAELRKAKVLDMLRSSRFLALRDALGTPFFLGTYEPLFRWLRRDAPEGSSPIPSAMLAGMVAGPIGWISIYPVEVYRINASRVVQDGQQTVMERVRHLSGGSLTLRSISTVWYKGLVAAVMRSVICIPVTMAVFESFRSYADTK